VRSVDNTVIHSRRLPSGRDPSPREIEVLQVRRDSHKKCNGRIRSVKEWELSHSRERRWYEFDGFSNCVAGFRLPSSFKSVNGRGSSYEDPLII
jgi:hypothetical protein